AAPSVRKAGEAARKLEEWSAAMGGASRVAASQAAAAPEVAEGIELAPGIRVTVASLGQEGEVVEVSGTEALVRLGALRIRRPVTDLIPLRGRAKGAALARNRSDRMRAAEAARAAPFATAARRLDVRGMRVEELVREVDAFLDRLLSEGAPDAVILHGHGTGALKQALRDHLQGSPYVASWRPGDVQEGGDAITWVGLRG
ncbi:MAG TPA: Smr/MutS family protein, partial [Anaeromyxobacteraceae bacterium]|nr:Smr/MutS family protein [Anaeromyxobacteraceae bacterium]